MRQYDYFIFAGELSADKYAKKIIEAIYKNNPNAKIAAVAGPAMREERIEKIILPTESFMTMGFSQVISSFPKLVMHFIKLYRWILANKPKVCIFIDYQTFTMLLEKCLRKKLQSEFIHVVAPKVWAWKAYRANTLANNIDKLFVLFNFEKKYFPWCKNVYKITHPLVTNYKQHIRKRSFSSQKPIVAIFPGSRKSVIKKNLVLHLTALKTMENECDIFISVANCSHKQLIEDISKQHLKNFTLVDSKFNHDLMADAKVAISTIGSVNIELALHKVPTVVTYAFNLIDLVIAKYIFKIDLPFYSIVNIIAKKELFPELLGPMASVQKIRHYTNYLIKNDNKILKQELHNIAQDLETEDCPIETNSVGFDLIHYL